MTFTGNKFPGLLLLEVISKENGKTIYESIQNRKFLIFFLLLLLFPYILFWKIKVIEFIMLRKLWILFSFL